MIKNRRKTDGWFGWITRFLDFVDRRDIDKHLVSLVILNGTWRLTEWAMKFADNHAGMTGLEMAAIIGAVLVPWTPLQGAAISMYFNSRRKNVNTESSQ